MLDKQVFVYSADTSAFYNDMEKEIHNRMTTLHIHRNKLKKLIEKSQDKELIQKRKKCLTITNKRINGHKDELLKVLKTNTGVRILDNKALSKRNIVSVFDSTLTRTMQLPINTLSESVIIVKTFFFDVLEDLVIDGFVFNGKPYIPFTASAGQLRNKKMVFVEKDVLEKHRNSLMCGLTVDKINELGGVNVNKYLAYLALCNSATDEWVDFDINKAIVVDDMETSVNGEVDFIDDETYEITRKIMDISICHTDGCGMILPKVSSKSFMVRLPWIKGLLVPFPFDKFVENNGHSGKIKDIYGKEWDLLQDGIEIIFTKSQFKMYKYYETWDQYRNNFITHLCQAGICNTEEDSFGDIKMGYQMIQSLNNMTDDELQHIAKQTKENILNMSSDRRTMLKVFGVTKSNAKKTYLQQAIELYPDLISDIHCKKVLKDIKRSLVKKGRAAKIELDGVYTFICPDLYAFCEYLFLGDQNPNGLLDDGQVACKLYKNEQKLDCLRNPHLYREHAVRTNIVNEELYQWYITNGLYTSCHDLISKILMFDNDGDKSLVCSDSVFVSAAERHMDGIVPLFYNMRKAAPEIISNQSIYSGLKLAYAGGNIGLYSNDITKIWNSDNVNLDIIKVLCMENNFTIDHAKTLYKPVRPKGKKKEISVYTKSKVPHFFVYAKDKKSGGVEKRNGSVVNRLSKIIPDKRIDFDYADFEIFDYKLLMSDSAVDIDQLIIDQYTKLDKNIHYVLHDEDDDRDDNNISYTYQDIRRKISELNSDVYYIVDVLIKYLYGIKNSKFKDTLWYSFGDIIVENLKTNMRAKYTYCEKCGVLTKQRSNRHKFCRECWRESEKESGRNRFNKWYHKNNSNGLENPRNT